MTLRLIKPVNTLPNMFTTHHIFILLALLFAVISLFVPIYPLLAVAVILLAVAEFFR